MGGRRSVGILVALFVAVLPVSASAAPSVLALKAREPDGPDHSLLVRELARQAVLIAARDELGQTTRDAALRETFPADAQPLDVAVAYEPSKQLRVTLLDADGKPAWEKSFTPAAAENAPERGIAELATLIEPATRDEIPAALRKLGYAVNAKPASQPAGVSNRDDEDRLRELTYFQQFDVLRDAHARLRAAAAGSADESRALGLLVRAYSNLGQLTQFHWHASHKVFKARALLYAQRLMTLKAANGGDPIALWHRAYARALIGLHAAALADLDAAVALNDKNPDRNAVATPPDWVTLVRPLCRYDVNRLQQAAADDRNLAGLAAYLAFTCAEFGGSNSAMIEFAKSAMAANPRCMRPINAVCIAGGVSYLHQATLMFPETFKRSLIEDLPRMRDLPKPVTEALDAAKDQWQVPSTRAKVAASLVAAGLDDAVEPSWGALATAVTDTYIVHVQRRIHFLMYQFGAGTRETAGFADAAQGLIGEHPDAAVIRSYPFRGSAAACMERLKGYQPADVELGMKAPIALHLRAVPGDEVSTMVAAPAYDQMVAHVDATATDLQQVVAMTSANATREGRLTGGIPAELKDAIARLHVVSPHNPTYVMFLIDNEWEQHAGEAPEWEKQYADMPSIAVSLARRYKSLGRYPDAARMYQRYVARSPDYVGYVGLADCYLAQGDEPKWLATLDEYLAKVEDYGLEHPNVQRRIAEHFMDHDDFKRALPYAEAAAESWAEWAMQCATRANEGVEDWARAELWARRISERYETARANWYGFCLRTGRGDLEAARRLAGAAAAARVDAQNGKRGPNGESRNLDAGMNLLADGRERQALELFRRGLDLDRDVPCGLLAATLLHAAGDAPGRDAILKKTLAAAEQSKSAPASTELARLVQAHFADAAAVKKPLDVAAVETIIAPAAPASAPSDAATAAYAAGRILAAQDQSDAAVRMYGLSAKAAPPSGALRNVAKDALTKLRKPKP